VITREELTGINLSGAHWRKSSRSNATGGNCVEVAGELDVRAVRDSKNAAGPVLAFGVVPFVAFLTAAQAGHFAEF
jgi:hypothetical protein